MVMFLNVRKLKRVTRFKNHHVEASNLAVSTLVMLSEAKHLRFYFSTTAERQSEILRCTQNNNNVVFV